MIKKEKLILNLFKEELKPIKKLLKDYQEQLNNIDKNGFDKEIHKGNKKSIYSGLNYTIGYCNGHIELTKKLLYYLSLSTSQIHKQIEEDKKITELNRKEMQRVFKEVKDSVNKQKKIKNK